MPVWSIQKVKLLPWGWHMTQGSPDWFGVPSTSQTLHLLLYGKEQEMVLDHWLGKDVSTRLTPNE